MKRLRRLLTLTIMVPVLVLPLLAAPVSPLMSQAEARNSVFNHIGDGWRGKRHRHTPDLIGKVGDGWKKGRWIPGWKPHSAWELLPICWGHPQKCRNEGERKPGGQRVATTQTAAPKFVSQLRIKCAKSTDVGNNHGDVTIPYGSNLSMQDARMNAVREYISGVDLCQKYHQAPSRDMRMVQGSGTFVD